MLTTQPLRVIFALACAGLATAHAADFNVTTSGYGDPGTLKWAVEQANATPGKDRVLIDPSLTFINQLVFSFSSEQPAGNRILITESVDIIGHGSGSLTLDDEMSFFGFGVDLNPSGKTYCDFPTDNILKQSDVVFQVGLSGEDSSDIEVTFQGFTLTNSGGLVFTPLPGGASIKIVDVRSINNRSANLPECNDLDVSVSGNLEIVDSLFTDFVTRSDDELASVVHVNGTLQILRSIFGPNDGVQGLATVNSNPVLIRDSRFYLSNGGQTLKFTTAGSDVSIVNTMVNSQTNNCAPYVWGKNVNLVLRNSSIIGDGAECTLEPIPGFPFPFIPGTHLGVEGGTLDIANTLIFELIPREDVEMVYLDGVSLTNRTNNFVSTAASALVLGGDTQSGDAGLSDPFLCLDDRRQPESYCVPLATSPLVDAGLDSAAIEPATAETLTLDLAGNPRISGAAVDIGAYETVFHVCDINLDGAVSKADVVLISQALRSTVDAGTYGDIDNDGRITSQDTRGCALQCTLARCAEPTP